MGFCKVCYALHGSESKGGRGGGGGEGGGGRVWGVFQRPKTELLHFRLRLLTSHKSYIAMHVLMQWAAQTP